MTALAIADSIVERELADIASVLASWYATHSSIRRLWAIKDSAGMTLIVTLEPTGDGGDTLPIWLANKRSWMDELCKLTGRELTLQLFTSDTLFEPHHHRDAITIAELCWRDP